jgi:hypothetical protein
MKIKPTVVMMNRGSEKVVSHLEYRHINKERGCAYKVDSNSMSGMEMKALREDGSEVKIAGQ